MLTSLEFDDTTISVEKTMLATTETAPAARQVGGTLYIMDLSRSVFLKRHKPIYLRLLSSAANRRWPAAAIQLARQQIARKFAERQNVRADLHLQASPLRALLLNKGTSGALRALSSRKSTFLDKNAISLSYRPIWS